MTEQTITVYGEHPDEAHNPSTCAAFRATFPKLFAPLQTETFERIRAGRSLALVAPTSSGKTLAVAAPLFEARRKTVFVYPFRALVLDQTNQLLGYGKPFGLTTNDFAQVMGGTPERELAKAVEKDYILMTPDKLVSLFEGGRSAKGAALAILSNYVFVFDEIHAYNSLMRASLVYFIRSVKYWREGVGGRFPAFYFLSATFPDELWPILQQELEMSEDDRIEGVSNTGKVSLLLRPSKEDAKEIAREMSDLGMTKNVVAIFNTAFKAWLVAQKLWGEDIARKRLFVGQDKMSEAERVRNFEVFTDFPEDGGLCGSPAIEAGVDFGAAHLVIDETFADSFQQRFGRAARSGQDATVLCYSSTLFNALQKGELKSTYTRSEFLNLVKQILPLREPRNLLTGLAAYPYYKFWDDPEFIESETLEICRKLNDKGVDHWLAFRGFIPYTHYKSGESINYRTLFKKELQMDKDQVTGMPSLERYFFAKRRPPVIAQLRKNAHSEKIDEHTTVFLAEVSFDGFGTHWVVLEYKSPEYERTHPSEWDDNICLRGLNSGEIGRITEDGVRNGILKFYDVDA
jgi:CRISPR/Cas system-associated endonuclease/helicase Cas3